MSDAEFNSWRPIFNAISQGIVIQINMNAIKCVDGEDWIDCPIGFVPIGRYSDAKCFRQDPKNRKMHAESSLIKYGDTVFDNDVFVLKIYSS